MQAVSESVFCFEDCTLDLRHGVLRRGDREIDLRAKSFEVLRYLVGNAGRLVSKDELIQAVWPNVNVADEFVARCVSDVRQALNDTEQRFHQDTAPRRGYRFAAAITLRAHEPKEPTFALPDKPSIAVLPFQNMSGDPEQEYFTDGITEDIITELSRFHSLFVIARNSSFSYKGKSPDIRQVGRELGVRYVLEGSIRKVVQSNSCDRPADRHVDRQPHLGGALRPRAGGHLRGTGGSNAEPSWPRSRHRSRLTEQSKAARRRPDNLSAYEIALRAWAHAWEGSDKADRTLLDQSIREAREALAIDPSSVRALHALARAHGMRSVPSSWRRIGSTPFGKPCGRPRVRSNWTVRMRLATRCEGWALCMGGQLDRYPDALADARRAHEMNPNDTFVLRILGDLGSWGRRTRARDRAWASGLAAEPARPPQSLTYNLLAFASFGAKQYAEGVRWASRAIKDRPRMVHGARQSRACLVGIGEIDKAKTAFAAVQKLASPEYFRSRLEGTSPYARPEDRRRATTFLRIAAGLEDPSAAEALR